MMRYSSSAALGCSTKVDSVSIAVAILLYDFYRPVQAEVWGCKLGIVGLLKNPLIPDKILYIK